MTKCTIGVSSAINSLNKMVNVILDAVDKCGSLNTLNKACGMSMSHLTTSASGITQASAGVAQKCFQGDGVNGLDWHHADPALCVINVKDTAQSIFKVVKAFLSLEKTKPCEAGDERGCAEKSLSIIGAFAGVGEYLAGSVGHCSPSGEFKGSNCGAQSERLAQQLTNFAKDAIDVSRTCHASAPAPAPGRSGKGAAKEAEAADRLYSAIKSPTGDAVRTTNVALAAFLPLTAIVGFVGGRFYGGRYAAQTREVITEGEE